jgi:hypothetical protein
MQEYGKYRATAANMRFFVDTGKTRVNKKGEIKKVIIPVNLRHIWMELITPDGNGMVWRYTMARKNKWSDSRYATEHMGSKKKESLSNQDVMNEISRLTSDTFAQRVFADLDEEVDRETYASRIGATIGPDNELTGGLMDRLAAQANRTQQTNQRFSRLYLKKQYDG